MLFAERAKSKKHRPAEDPDCLCIYGAALFQNPPHRNLGKKNPSLRALRLCVRNVFGKRGSRYASTEHMHRNGDNPKTMAPDRWCMKHMWASWRYPGRWRIFRFDDRLLLILIAIIVGICAGLAAVALNRALIAMLEWLHPVRHYWWGFVLPAIGAALSSIFLHNIVNEGPGHGVPEVIYSVSRYGGLMRLRSSFSRLISSCLTIGSGSPSSDVVRPAPFPPFSTPPSPGWSSPSRSSWASGRRSTSSPWPSLRLPELKSAVFSRVIRSRSNTGCSTSICSTSQPVSGWRSCAPWRRFC
ncbi:Chloride channel protein [Olavius algarvensis associated proteobacterium Delta 3]|nr:Chloride channel protein [Olavius algarvensis associated proteobacterium Delta 3]